MVLYLFEFREGGAALGLALGLGLGVGLLPTGPLGREPRANPVSGMSGRKLRANLRHRLSPSEKNLHIHFNGFRSNWQCLNLHLMLHLPKEFVRRLVSQSFL